MRNGFLRKLSTCLRLIVITFSLLGAANSYAEGASLNLKNADIHSLIETVAMATGKTLSLTPESKVK